MKLINHINIKGKIKVKTGLHIGGGSDTIQIGGTDNPVIKDPLTNRPFIPGSSLKGKLRSILEWKLGKTGKPDRKGNIGPCDCGELNCPICTMFGAGSTNAQSKELGPSRLIFRDAFLSDEFETKVKEEGLQLTEIKAETAIDRAKGNAKSGSLRQTERVCAGVEFDFNISCRIFDQNDDNGKADIKNLKALKEAFDELKYEALGGNGSRGYGRIEIEFDKPIDEIIKENS